MTFHFGLTNYAAKNWLQLLTAGPNAVLVKEKMGNTYIYRRKTANGD
jgi:hypothetical protein